MAFHQKPPPENGARSDAAAENVVRGSKFTTSERDVSEINHSANGKTFT